MGNQQQGARNSGDLRLRQATGEQRALSLISSLDPSGGFTPEQTLTLWRAYDTTGNGQLQRPEALKFFRAIVERLKELGQLGPTVDSDLAAERIYVSMDTDGNGHIAWGEWAKMSDGQWATVLHSAHEAVQQAPASQGQERDPS